MSDQDEPTDTLDAEHGAVRELLMAASELHMPQDVFARIQQALSVEVQLRHEDPERDGGSWHGRTPPRSNERRQHEVLELDGLTDVPEDDLDDCESLD